MEKELEKLLEKLIKDHNEESEDKIELPKRKGTTKEELMNLVEEKLKEMKEEDIQSFVIIMSNSEETSSSIRGGAMDIALDLSTLMSKILESCPIEFGKSLLQSCVDTAIEIYEEEHPKRKSIFDILEANKGDK